MAYQNAKTTKMNSSSFKSLWTIITLILVGFGAVAGVKFFKWRKTQPTDINKEADKVNPSKEIQKIAREVSQHLGTSYFWMNPRSWSENDKEVFELLKDLTQSEFDQVARLYKGADIGVTRHRCCGFPIQLARLRPMLRCPKPCLGLFPPIANSHISPCGRSPTQSL